MAVASDLPALENEPQYRGDGKRNSVLFDSHGRALGRLAVRHEPASTSGATRSRPWMKVAIVAIEDERFQTNSGVDLRGIARAFTQDIVQQRSAQGGSTITQQFVKNALQAQDQRTVFQKLREAALAYHLTRKWSKQKILTEYLNSIYFGNGAYGIESAARDVLRQGRQPRGLRDAAGDRAPRSSSPRRRRCSPASSRRRAPTTRSPTPSPPARGATWSCARCSTRATSTRPSTTRAVDGVAAGAERRSARRRSRARRRTSRPGCASSSSTATARGAPSRAA